jgi:hypothetical protein
MRRPNINMHKAQSINEIVLIKDCNELVAEFYFFLSEKNLKYKLNEIEEVVYLLLNMLSSIEMDGFVDLFHQQYSLRECLIVENSLRQFEFNKLADLFSEAKSIFINNKFDITQEEYEQIPPFAYEERPNGERFNEIGELFLAKDSEIYHLGDGLCKFIKSNGEFLLTSNTQTE